MDDKHLAKLKELRARAQAQNAQYPQYESVFDDHVLYIVTSDVSTKLGQAFSKDELAICDPEAKILPHFSGANFCFTVYSFRNRVNTGVPFDDVMFISEDDDPTHPEWRLKVLERQAADLRSKLRKKNAEVRACRAAIGTPSES